MWCSGLITPIFKSGGRTDPTNYRGICAPSCLGKLFCSILNQRPMEHVDSLNILHNSQIGNQTADHVLALRTLIDKYVHCHQEKGYACLVDFRKAFDSLWHDGLLNKLLQLNVGGNFYDLIKYLYDTVLFRFRENWRFSDTTFSVCKRCSSWLHFKPTPR